MIQISTTYKGPGNIRGARIIAKDTSGNAIHYPYPHHLSGVQVHLAAALALMEKHGIKGAIYYDQHDRGYSFAVIQAEELPLWELR